MSDLRNSSPDPQHLDEMACLLYIERQLDGARAQEFSAHLRECEACRTLLRALERESRLLTRAMLEEEEALPARLAEFQQRARRSMQWIWGVAFGLAATGVYALYSGYIEPWQQQLDQAGFGSSNLVSMLIFQGAFWKGWQSMITLFEVLAMLTLGGLGLAFFRRRLRRGSVFALVLPGLCALLIIPQAASATEFRKGETVEVRQTETIKGDIFLFGDHTRVDGTVDGDVFIFSEEGKVNGHVTGDVIAFAQSLRINGQVDGNVRAATNNITISGPVGKNVLTFDEMATVDSSGKIGGSFTAFVKSLTLDGRIGRDILLFADHAGISGGVGGALQAKGNTLEIRAGAEIDGPVHFEGSKPPEVSPEAKLASPVDYKKLERRPRYMEGSYYVWQVIWAAAFVLFGLVLFLLMPKFSEQSVGNAERYGASFGLGLLVGLGVPIAAIIACVTVVGLFIGISAFFIWYAALYYAQVIVGALVGQWLMGRTRDLWPMIGRMVVGVLLVRLCTTVPQLGVWIKLGVVVWGLGAISLALYQRFQPAITPSQPSSPVSSPLPSNTTIGGVQPA